MEPREAETAAVTSAESGAEPIETRRIMLQTGMRAPLGVKVFGPEPDPSRAHGEAPGTVLEAHPEDPAEGMLVACGEGAVWVREVQPAGRKRMRTSDWLRGRGALC